MRRFDWRVAAGVAAIAMLSLILGCGPGGAGSAIENNKNLIQLTSANFQSEVLNSSQPVLIDFWATWCGPCKTIAPVVSELATEFEGKAKIGKVDVDAQPELARQYNISAIPALFIFKDGKKIDEIIGVQSKAELKARLEAAIGSNPAVPVVPKS